jgi:hypothetical protein
MRKREWCAWALDIWANYGSPSLFTSKRYSLPGLRNRLGFGPCACLPQVPVRLQRQRKLDPT